MGRLVDLDTVPHRRVRFKTSNDSSSMANELDVVFYEDLIQLPTVDAVPVVRCKDCKHAEWWGNFDPPAAQYFCKFMDANVELKDDDFCSKGERRRETDDGNLL